MTAPAITVNLSAQIDSTSGPVSIGTMLVPVNGLYVVATTANRVLGGRAHGIALTAWGTAIPGAVRLQHVGVVDSAVTGLGVGAASWVRVSATGTAERCTPAGSDDIIGWCWTDGTLMMLCGLLTAAIVNGSGGGGGATLPIDLAGGAGTVINLLPVGNQASQTMAGDVTGTTAASTVAKVNGATYPAAGALVTGTIPRVTGTSAVAYGALDLANASAITGVLPSASAPSHAGDVTGAHTATVVVKVNGASVPAAGALTTGNAAYVSGASALTYSALNLAGGSGYVTGVLPTGNQASQAMAGDVTGTTAASTVAKVNGATYPAAGALTTGTVPRVTGASAVAYGALDLANASAVTGTLPTGNQASQAMAGDVTGTTAASVVAKINGATVLAAGALTTGHVLKVTSVSSTTYGFVADANVSATAAIAGTKIAPNFGSQDVVTTGSYAAGTTPAVSGQFRVPNNVDVITGKTVGGTDVGLLGLSAGNALYVGASNGGGTHVDNLYLYPNTGGQLLTTGAGAIVDWTGSQVSFAVPIGGFSTAWRYAVGVLNTTSITTFTASSAQYACPILQHTSSAGSGTAIWNLPNSAGATYIVDNQSAATVITLKVAGQTGVTVAVLKKATIYCNGTDYVRVTPDT